MTRPLSTMQEGNEALKEKFYDIQPYNRSSEGGFRNVLEGYKKLVDRCMDVC